jgi:hypothetical protein
LRLRDRQKKEASEDTAYVPSKLAQPTESKPEKSIESGYNPLRREPPKEEKPFSINASDKNEDSYTPSYRRAEKDLSSIPAPTKINDAPQ